MLTSADSGGRHKKWVHSAVSLPMSAEPGERRQTQGADSDLGQI